MKVSNIQSVSLEEYPHRDAHHVVRRIYDAFGPERLMWGTDFPGAMRRIRYDQALELVRTHLEFLTEEDKEWLFSRMVQQVWTFGDR